MVSRVLYITFQILYLITLAVVLWFLLYYSGVPSWVWIFFGVAILLEIISAIIEETLIWTVTTSEGKTVTTRTMGLWAILFIILNISAFILIIIGLIFVIKYSTIPWWVWLIFGIAILVFILAGLFGLLGSIFITAIFWLVAVGLFIAGVILVIIYSKSPWWVWLIVGLAVLFAILASIFNSISYRTVTVVTPDCPPGKVNCPVVVKAAPVTVTTPTTVTVQTSALPTANIPEQIVV